MSGPSPKRRRAFAIAGLVVILVLAVTTGSILYSIHSAERRAHLFCENVAVDSDVSASVGRAKKEGILYGSNGGYDFYFPTMTGFDKAVCSVSVDNNGKVTSKRWAMEYD
jgi:hypothetical protein